MALLRRFGTNYITLCTDVYQSMLGQSGCQQCIRRWMTLETRQKKIISITHQSVSNVYQSRPFSSLSSRYYGLHMSKSPFQRTGITRQFKRQSKQTADDAGPSLLKHVMYTVVVCGGSFYTAAMVYKYRMMKKWDNMYKGQYHDMMIKKSHGRDRINRVWNTMPELQKVVYGIIAINAAVFILWRVKSLQPVMSRYFLGLPGNPVMSMTLSSFSHVSGIHLLVNMYVLLSFSGAMKMETEEFLALYLSAGTISSLVSNMLKVTRSITTPSVGASGAIIALIGICGYNLPDAKVSIAFVDQIIPHSFSIWNAVVGLLAIDSLGVLLRWRFLDHAGHLGGMLTGLFYGKYGNQLWKSLPPVKSANKGPRG